MRNIRRDLHKKVAYTMLAALFGAGSAWAQPERVLGVDISYWNCGQGSGISQANWNTGFSTGNRKFAWIRATRGGTTGVDQPQGTPGGGSSSTLSRRYDDSRFIQNIGRAAASGMLSGPYHFARPDVAGNTGTDEANHFMQMAGPWMRPGYMVPVFDQEAGSGGDFLAQFAIDFSDRIYAVMKIRPGIYINGNYSGIFQGATVSRRDQLAKPAALSPSVVSPAYPMLWDARYSDNSNPNAIPVQTGNPRNTYTLSSGYYGPWDDYGNAQPWGFWQYASTVSVPGFNSVDSTIDSNVSQGDIEYVRNYLVPAVWWNDSSGDWGTLANWNSGQPVVAPIPGAGQATPYATGPLPIARLPGAAGVIPNSGQFDTVILERPSANITVTLSSGSYNIRKLYMRESLNITGGSLAINYNPTYRADDTSTVLHGGPISAQFSGPVALSGSGSLNVHTLQVDATRSFSLGGGALTFNKINLVPHGTTPAKMAVTGNVTFNPLANAVATISNGSGSGNTGWLDLGAETRTLTIGNGADDVDLSFEIPVSNGGLTKAGAGTLRLTKANTYSLGTVITAGRLLVNNMTGSATGNGSVMVNGGILGGAGVIAGAVTVSSGGTISPGTSIGTLFLNSAPTLNGTTVIEINRNGGSPLADKLAVGSGTLNYGGTLAVSNVGAALTGGEVFPIFSANAYAGAFASTILPSLNSGLNWHLGDLTANGTIKVNRRPNVNALAVTNNFPGVLQIPIATLTSNGTDADGDTLSLSGFLATTNGVTLTSDGTFLIYSNSVNVADKFNFVVTDGHGGFATNTVSLAPKTIVTGAFAQVPSADATGVTLYFSGTPGATFFIDRSTNLPTWLTISTNVAPPNGLFNFTDNFQDLNEPPVASFYRLRWEE